MTAWSFAIILSLSVFYVKVILAAIDSTAILLECEKDSSKDDIKRKNPPYHTIDNCIRKIRITLNISNTGKTPPELAYTFLGYLADPDTGAKMYLLNPIVLRLRQEQVLLAYPFHYLSAVNARAKEIVLNYENRKNFTGCDDTSRINPTCGLKHERGKGVPFSEGFCCFCPEMPVNEKQPRGGQDCSLKIEGDPYDLEKQKYKASAHCLHLDEIWYSVSALSKPFILHETFLQVYVEKQLKDGSSSWFALTHDEDFALSPQNTFLYDENKTLVISYITSTPDEAAVTIPLSERRLLTPQPMPSIEIAKSPPPVKNGAIDYILLPKDIIDPEGDVCDVAGVSYEGFAKQPDRCNMPKTTCLKNQPLDFWDMDDEKRKVGAKGSYLLENFGIPYKDPIIVDPETKEHWLALEYHELHHTYIIAEVNADEITILTLGKYAQISKITSSIISKNINIIASVLNSGLMPAMFTVQAVKCAYGVPNSNKELVTIPPQLTEDVLIMTVPGSTALDEKFECTVQVSTEAYGVVAKREVVIHPRSRCICNFHCECACMSDSLECELMSEEDYQAAGFRGSLPVLTAKPPYRIWFVAHPYLALLTIFLVLLLIGLIKSILGLAGCKCIGNFGMDKVFYRPGKIKRYPQRELRDVEPVYDDEGYPIHPDTRERVKVIRDELLFVFNLLFMFFWPCLKCRQCFKKAVELKKKMEQKNKLSEDIKEKKGKGAPGVEEKKDDVKKPVKEPFFKRNKRKKDKELTEKDVPGKTLKEGELTPAAKDDKERPGGYQHRQSISASKVEETPFTSGPVADPLNKERERWYKGKKMFDTIKK